MQKLREEQRERLVQELKEGEIRKGKITGTCSFGAFVDLGGAEGLVHISELSWDSVSSPDEFVNQGDEVDVYILKIDSDTKRIALSLRRTRPGPWDTITERYQEGQLVTGTITNLSSFGAFARLEDSIEGLIHISELSSRLIRHPKEVVKEGDVVGLKILRIEPERRRLGLSLKQAEEEGQ
jgi:small subunit ribosomal protein S1